MPKSTISRNEILGNLIVIVVKTEAQTFARCGIHHLRIFVELIECSFLHGLVRRCQQIKIEAEQNRTFNNLLDAFFS